MASKDWLITYKNISDQPSNRSHWTFAQDKILARNSSASFSFATLAPLREIAFARLLRGCLICALLLLSFRCSRSPASHEDINWTLGSSTSLIPQVDAQTLREVKSSGIDLIELGWRNLNWQDLSYDERLANVRRLYADARDAGLTIWSTHIPYGEDVDISNPDDTHRLKAIARVKEFIDLAIEMRCKQIVLHPSERIQESTREERLNKCRESLKELSAYMKGKGVTLALESLPPDFMGNSSTELLRLIDGIDHMSICFDTNHLVPEKPEEFVRAAGHKITTVHISDFDGAEQKHWMPGRGTINWPLVIDELLKAGYSGPFMYEVVRREGESHTFRDLKANYEGLIKEWGTVIGNR